MIIAAVFTAGRLQSCLTRLALPALSAMLTYGQISAPVSGFVRVEGSPIERLYGIPGNLVIAPATFGTATAASFSEVGGLIAQDGSLKLLNGKGVTLGAYQTSEPSPVLAMNGDLTGAIAWLPGSHELIWWNGNVFEKAAVEIDAEDEVTSVVRCSTKRANLLVTHAGREASLVIVSLPAGEVISSDVLPGTRGPAFRFGSHLMWLDDQGLEIENNAGVRQTLPFPSLPAGLHAERISSHWVHLFSPGSDLHWALHLTGTEAALSILPVSSKANR